MLLYLPEDGAGLFPPESYDRRSEPSGGFAGTAGPKSQGGWAQEVASLPRNTPAHTRRCRRRGVRKLVVVYLLLEGDKTPTTGGIGVPGLTRRPRRPRDGMQNTPHVNLLYTPALREERVVDAVAGVVIDPRRFSEERVGDGVGKSYKCAAAAAAAQLRAPTRFKIEPRSEKELLV